MTMIRTEEGNKLSEILTIKGAATRQEHNQFFGNKTVNKTCSGTNFLFAKTCTRTTFI